MSIKLRDVTPYIVVAEGSIDRDQWPNFLVIAEERFSRYVRVGFLDTVDFKAKQVIQRYNARVKFLKYLILPENDLTYNIAKVHKEDYTKFLDSMRELRNVHAILGNQAYARTYLAWRVEYKDREFYMPGDLPRKIAYRVINSLIGDERIGGNQ